MLAVWSRSGALAEAVREEESSVTSDSARPVEAKAGGGVEAGWPASPERMWMRGRAGASEPHEELVEGRVSSLLKGRSSMRPALSVEVIGHLSF